MPLHKPTVLLVITLMIVQSTCWSILTEQDWSKILNPKLLLVALPAVCEFVWMIITPDEPVAPYMVASATSVWVYVNGWMMTCVLKRFEWSLRLEKCCLSTACLRSLINFRRRAIIMIIIGAFNTFQTKVSLQFHLLLCSPDSWALFQGEMNYGRQ